MADTVSAAARPVWAALVLAALAGGCGGGVSFSADEWAVLHKLSPLPEKPPPEPTNKYADNQQAAQLGQMIFFDKRLAGPLKVGPATAANGRSNGALGNVGETQKIACTDCHMPSSGWFFDIRSNNGLGGTANATSLGADWGTRNVSSIVNTAYYRQQGGDSAPHWRENDGYADSAWSDAQSEPEGPEIQNGSRLQLAHLIFDKYQDLYTSIFTEWPLPPLSSTTRFPPTGQPGDPSYDNMAPADQEAVNRVFMNYGKAIEAYIRLLVSRNAPFDQFVAGDSGAISTSAQRGLKLFIGQAGCVKCHNTPLFSDDDFHIIGLKIDTTLSPYADPTEQGRYDNEENILSWDFNVNGPYSDDRNTGRLGGFQVNDQDKGKWRTKALRQVGATAPYMRDGHLATLDEVIDFYDRGGDPDGMFVGGPREIQPLHLSADQKADLKEFLLTLTGEPVHAALMQDTHRP